jgi:triacylglycerol lipase
MTSGDENNNQSGPKQLDHAILFLHGLDDFRFFRWIYPRYRYFRLLDRALSDTKIPLYFPEVRCNGSIKERGQQLFEFIENVSESNLHLIAHSMGGLDARYLISKLDSSARIRSLRTVATPHRGTAVASWALETSGIRQWLIRHYNMPGLADLTEEACEKFNEENRDRTDVDYYSFNAARPISEFPWFLRRYGKLIDNCAGKNDSMVPVSSALWENSSATIRAHHAELVGWRLGSPKVSNGNAFDHVKFYRSLIEDIMKSIS